MPCFGSSGATALPVPLLSKSLRHDQGCHLLLCCQHQSNCAHSSLMSRLHLVDVAHQHSTSTLKTFQSYICSRSSCSRTWLLRDSTLERSLEQPGVIEKTAWPPGKWQLLWCLILIRCSSGQPANTHCFIIAAQSKVPSYGPCKDADLTSAEKYDEIVDQLNVYVDRHPTLKNILENVLQKLHQTKLQCDHHPFTCEGLRRHRQVGVYLAFWRQHLALYLFINSFAHHSFVKHIHGPHLQPLSVPGQYPML